jgi:hypothetical protein
MLTQLPNVREDQSTFICLPHRGRLRSHSLKPASVANMAKGSNIIADSQLVILRNTARYFDAISDALQYLNVVT